MRTCLLVAVLFALTGIGCEKHIREVKAPAHQAPAAAAPAHV